MIRNMLLIAIVFGSPVAAKSPPVYQSSQPVVTITQPATPVGDPANWFSSDDYPAEAMRNGGTGTVNATLAIDETGKVMDCSVTESSQNQTLDDATCALLMVRARFNPARNAAGQPIATTFHRKVRWLLPQQTDREIWTLDQIRFPTPKDAKILAPLAADHSMEAVVQRLKSLGIVFERSSVQRDTIQMPVDVALINRLPPTEPFMIPQGTVTTINIITSRKPVVFDGTAAKPFPLPSPLSVQMTITFDVDGDGNLINCEVKGNAAPWTPPIDYCKAMETSKPKFSPDATKQTRHVVQIMQTTITSTAPKAPNMPAK